MSSTPCRIAIAIEPGASESLNKTAQDISAELAIPIAQRDSSTDLTLHVRTEGLALGSRGSRTLVSVDFLKGPTAYRSISAAGKRQPLPRALGLHKGITNVLDATAGLGRDAFQLAAIGCNVTSIERSHVLAVMLKNAHARGLHRGSLQVRETLSRLNFVHADAREFLESLDNSQLPDAIYLDPMFPSRPATALAKKQMRIVRDLVGPDIDAPTLLTTARRFAKHRVVVKRHPHSDPVAPDPIASHGGTRIRYDVYAPTT